MVDRQLGQIASKCHTVCTSTKMTKMALLHAADNVDRSQERAESYPCKLACALLDAPFHPPLQGALCFHPVLRSDMRCKQLYAVYAAVLPIAGFNGPCSPATHICLPPADKPPIRFCCPVRPTTAMVRVWWSVGGGRMATAVLLRVATARRALGFQVAGKAALLFPRRRTSPWW